MTWEHTLDEDQLDQLYCPGGRSVLKPEDYKLRSEIATEIEVELGDEVAGWNYEDLRYIV